MNRCKTAFGWIVGLLFAIFLVGCMADAVGVPWTNGDSDLYEAESDEESEDSDDTDSDGTETEPEDISGSGGCDEPFLLRCNSQVAGNSEETGRDDTWSGYSCTARYESGREVIYALTPDDDCEVVVRLIPTEAKDLDLFLLSSCEAFSGLACSSTPQDIQNQESVTFDAEKGVTYYTVVDGYDMAAGAYRLEVECSCNSSK